MKQIWRRFLVCFLAVCLLMGCLSVLKGTFERKASASKYSDFFGQKAPFDVLFFGTSHGVYGVYPMELWNDRGIVSYNLSCNRALLPFSYWLLQLSLRYTKPSLVVIDCLGLERNEKISRNKISDAHVALDAFPISWTKIRAVTDLMNDEYGQAVIPEDKQKQTRIRNSLELLWDFAVYHSRWKELTKEDFCPVPSFGKGAGELVGTELPDQNKKIERNKKINENTVGVYYLEKMIDECQKRGIEVLLMFLPFPASQRQQAAANRIYDIAEEYGVRYINFLDLDVVNYDTDCYDANSHLNASGARKVTAYLGRYLSEECHVPDRRADDGYSEWNHDYLAYRDYINQKLLEQTDLDAFLSLLMDKNYDVLLEIGDRRILECLSYRRQLENIGLNVDKIPGDSMCVSLSGGQDIRYEPAEKDMEASLRITVTDRVVASVVDKVSISFLFDSHQELVSPLQMEHLSIEE